MFFEAKKRAVVSQGTVPEPDPFSIPGRLFPIGLLAPHLAFLPNANTLIRLPSEVKKQPERDSYLS